MYSSEVNQAKLHSASKTLLSDWISSGVWIGCYHKVQMFVLVLQQIEVRNFLWRAVKWQGHFHAFRGLRRKRSILFPSNLEDRKEITFLFELESNTISMKECTNIISLPIHSHYASMSVSRKKKQKHIPPAITIVSSKFCISFSAKIY